MNETNKLRKKKVTINEVTGELELPSGNDPFQNAWLTLTLGYGLNFIDSRTPGTVIGDHAGGPIVVNDKNLGWCARDTDDFLFPILEWGYDSIKKFVKLFQQGEHIWNHRFLIKPPENFDKLDYSSPAYPGYVMRPNILCLFRMQSGAKNSNLFNVVRINPSVFEDATFQAPNYSSNKTKPARHGFRSHESLLTDEDVFTPVLGHELGHAINEDHIMALKGDAECKISPNLSRCYGITPEEIRNIMGAGTEITEINVAPWLDHLHWIVGGDPMRCKIVMLTDPKIQPLPPRKIPIAQPAKSFIPGAKSAKPSGFTRTPAGAAH